MSRSLEFHGPWVSNTGDSGAFYESLQWGRVSLDPGESFNKVEGTKARANGVQGHYTPGVIGINDGGTAMVGRGTMVDRHSPEEFREAVQRSNDNLAELERRTGRNADGTLLSGVDVVDPVTGGAKGMKPERYGLIPTEALAEVARVYGYGSEKYDDNNWRKGYRWGLSYDALQRHINAFWGGEELDPESGLHHLAHAAFHLFALMTYSEEGLGTDDRAG